MRTSTVVSGADPLRGEDFTDRGGRPRYIECHVLAVRLAHEALDGRGCGRIDQRHGREVDDVGLGVLADAIQRGDIRIAGTAGRVSDLMALLDDFEAGFPIIEPLATR